MKNIASIAIATIALFTTPALKAGDCGHHKHHGHSSIIVGGFGVSFAPRYVTTKELHRSIQTQWGYDSWGHLVTYNVLTITYADYYSDGSARTYARSYRM